jgi:hypothetical protein
MAKLNSEKWKNYVLYEKKNWYDDYHIYYYISAKVS